jgi:hypothetical protein
VCDSFAKQHKDAVQLFLAIFTLIAVGFTIYEVYLLRIEVYKEPAMQIALNEPKVFADPVFPHLCSDMYDDITGTLSIINTGFRPIVLSNAGSIKLVCPSHDELIIGGISTDEDGIRKVLQLDRPLIVNYTITRVFARSAPSKNCTIVFEVYSEDKQHVSEPREFDGVEVKECR